MSLTFIIGETGAGKTAFATYLLKEKYITEGRNLLRRSCRIIEEANRKYDRNYTVPDKVPFYTNYNVKLHVGYRKYYEPYFLNGYYFGVENEEIDTERIAPGSTLVVDEAQRIYDSRKSATFPDWASYAFEIHRQGYYDIYLLAQRGMLIDRNIKELGVHVIEIQRMENEKDAAGNVAKSTWYCREFENWSAAQQYIEKGEKTYKETTNVHEGNIFENFDSHEKLKEFLPAEGKDFDYPPQTKTEKITEREKKFYKSGKPKYRQEIEEKNKQENVI